MSPAALGAARSAFFLGYTLMQIPGGYLTDRFGARAVVISTLILWSLLTGFTGLAWSFSALVIIRFLFGVAEGPYPAAALKQVAQKSAQEKKRAQLTALLMSSNYAGAAIAPSSSFKSSLLAVGVVPLLSRSFWDHLSRLICFE